MGRRGRPEALAGNRVLLLLPALLIVFGVIVHLATPAHVAFSALFAAAPLVVAPLFSARATALAGLAATLTLGVLLPLNDRVVTTDELMKVATVASLSALALFINHVVREAEKRLASARGVAEAAQLAVLPTPPARIGALEIAARYEAAHADALIGGDLYAVEKTPHGVRLLVGDVRGKGLGAVGAVALAIGTFREAAEQETSLEQVAARLDHALLRERQRREGVEYVEGFITAVLAEVADNDRLRLVNRGHPPPLLLYADGADGTDGTDGTVRTLEPSTPALPLGLGDLNADRPVPVGTDETAFPPGATLLLYTDGLTEARNASGAFYEPARRASTGGWAQRDPDGLLDALLADVARHTAGEPTDDMALLAVANRP
ncbi:PP2C family protein-serine/threonine phosphatase [Streptomyces gobiensis]|uniref:PP2C family protein-serine/threonine phosphatase n=1 Tax=Streptomyces gobiensis TaxID=2875706 RepID=UPI001E3E8FDD|nr:PP2C family protein-serine/threonine phosphatase [Streptomyces gobiensis]UGY92777.1 serine/threonine-protein phosphatase [Streptomyces gobiensis]